MQRDPSVPRRRRRRPRGIVVLAAAALGMLTMLTPASAHISPVPPPYAAFDLGTPDWTHSGHDLFNTRNNPYEHDINTRNVSSLAPKWTFTTHGDVSATPAVVGDTIIFPDWAGYLYKLNRHTGQLIWQKQISDYNGLPNSLSRTSPLVSGNTIYIGDQNAANFSTGTHLMAIDATTGALKWITTADTNFAAVMTQSPTIFNGVLYVGVSSKQAATATVPGLPFGTFRGSLLAVQASTGKILWQKYTVPDNGGQSGGYSGGGVWGGEPVVDPYRGLVYIGSGQNLSVPQSVSDCQTAGGTPQECLSPDDHIDSMLAFRMSDGKPVWEAGAKMFDTWTAACNPGQPPQNCPPNPGLDSDFADGMHIAFPVGPDGRPHEVVTAGQKNGDYWQVDPGTGKVLWRTTVGPAGLHGGVEWGSATDNKRIYLSQANSNHVPFTLMNGETTSGGFFAALDAQTGKILWETADPTANETPGAVTVANGVMYATSISGKMFALDGATGKILWSYQGQGSANAGPAVVDGTVYWGNGYQNLFYPHGVHSTTFYAFTPGGR